MTAAASTSIAAVTLLRLGRVSNLPTVWTNVLAGTVLAGGEWRSWALADVMLATSLLYIAGMYLNDYYDRVIDARERPERPIPGGEIPATTVALIGYGLLLAGIALLVPLGRGAALAGLLLAAAIVGYDLFHKSNPVAPVVMGACRALVYCAAAAAVAGFVPAFVALAALSLLAYVAGLTYAAKQESLDRIGNLWPLLVLAAPLVLALPALSQGVGALVYAALLASTVYAVHLLARRPMPGSVPAAVGRLIAGISLVDAALLAASGALTPALLAVAGFVATRLGQRFIAGT
jgi:4-hydroxybenzoate polyprenyltransferase